MIRMVLLTLIFMGGLFANELEYFVVSDSMVAEYDKLPKAVDTTEAFEILESKLLFYYPDRIEMDKDLRTLLVKYPQFHNIVNNFSLGNPKIQKRLATGLAPDDSVVDFVWFNKQNLDFLKKCLRPQALRSPYSKSVSRFLHGLEGVYFADSLMMRRYALSLFSASLNVCYDNTSKYDKVVSSRWSDDDVADLFAHKYKDSFTSKFRTSCIDSARTMNRKRFEKSIGKDSVKNKELYKDCKLYRALNRWFVNSTCSDDRWNFAFTRLDSLYSRLLQSDVEAATQREIPFDDEVPVVWNSDGCGCSQNKDLNGNVFALYPYWLAKEDGDTLDFSAVTRINYYGISADDNGFLKMPSGSFALDYFDKEGFSDFVNVAHRHNVKVDWVVKKSEWGELSSDTEKLQAFFDSLANQIDALVSRENNSFFQRFVSCLAIDGHDNGYRGDGVTLWFQNYPTDPEFSKLFTKNFIKIQEKLQTTNKHVLVNLMVNMLDLTEKQNVYMDSNYVAPQKGIYSYEYFGTLLDSIGDSSLQNYLIVLSDEPVSRSKLQIYHDLNQQLKGDSRTNVLHAVVPMLWLDFQQWDQLKDDATFYNDAYYSLGVAPYGLLNDTTHQEQALDNILLEKFEKENGAHERQGPVAAFFCTHRFFFRLLNTVVYAMVFLLLFCYFAVCRMNAYFSKRLALLVALVAIPPLLTSLILTNFDPVIIEYVGKVGRWGSFVFIILTVIVITLLQVYRSAEYPRRK